MRRTGSSAPPPTGRGFIEEGMMQQQHSPARPREPPPPSPWVPGGSRLDWMVIRERISGANLIGLAPMPIAAAPDAGARAQPRPRRSRTPGAVEPGADAGSSGADAREQWSGRREKSTASCGRRRPSSGEDLGLAGGRSRALGCLRAQYRRPAVVRSGRQGGPDSGGTFLPGHVILG
jgi:hypothetical protein